MKIYQAQPLNFESLTVPAEVTAGLERIVRFEPAFDRRSDDAARNYGVHGVTLRFVLKGRAGAVQFVVYTNWQLEHVFNEWRSREWSSVLTDPLPCDLGYHSRRPMHEGQRPMGTTKIVWEKPDPDLAAAMKFDPDMRVPTSYPIDTYEPCEYLDGEPCYYDGSSLNAQRMFSILTESGSDGVWQALGQYYFATFHAGVSDSAQVDKLLS